MANGRLADRNRVAAAAVDEAGWSAAAPAAYAKVLPLKLSARSLLAGTTALPTTLKGVFAYRQPVSYCALFKTNLRQNASYRLRLYADASYSTLLYDTRDAATGIDRKVVPCLSEWRSLRFGDPNLLRGDLPPEDFALYPTNVHVTMPVVRARAFRWDIVGLGYGPTGADVDYNEIGHAWASDSLYLTLDRSFGAADVYTPGDEINTVVGGNVFVEPGTGRRSTSIPLEFIGAAGRRDSDALADLSRRVNFDLPVVWLPDADSPADMFRYGFIAQKRGSHAKTWENYRYDTATVELEEITT